MSRRPLTPILAALALAAPLSLGACGDDKKSSPDTTSDTSTPDTATPDTATPDTTPPVDTTPDTSPPDDATPDTTPPVDTTPDTTADTGPDATIPFVATYQVWATDQGLSRVNVWEPREDDAFELVGSVDYVALYPADSEGPKPRTPHMVDFSPDRRYAFVAHTTSGHTTVIRTSDLSVVSVLETGPGTHMARVSPTGNVYIDVIGNAEFPGRVLQLDTDYETETFSVLRKIIIKEDPLFDADIHPSSSPVCGTSTPTDSHQFVTFGPGFGGAMLAIIDNEDFTLTRIYDPTIIRANCGSLVGPDGRYYFTGGRAATQEVPGLGVWYVIDPESLEPIPFGEDDEVERTTHGTDAHGIAFTADGEEIWLINRDSDNIAIVDAETYALKENVELEDFDGPDIVDISEDGRFFFVTMRGPNPRSGPHSIAGTTPGVAVLDIASRTLVTLLQGDDDSATDSDYHGLRVLVFPTE